MCLTSQQSCTATLCSCWAKAPPGGNQLNGQDLLKDQPWMSAALIPQPNVPSFGLYLSEETVNAHQ